MDADDLYGLPLDQFVPERTALAKSLRADGRRDEAKAVSALRKPSVAAWAVNQLVRTQGKAIDSLFAAGDGLVEVQSGVLAGDREPGELREAATTQREAVDELLATARGLLSSEGVELSQSVVDRVAETLQAAALDPEARSEVQAATLVRELRHVGLGGGMAPGAAPTPGPKAKRAPKPKPQAQARRAEVKQVQREREQTRRAARHAEADSRRAAERAQRALEVAQERRDKAAQALADADRAVEEAHEAADRTAQAHRVAKQALDAL